MKIPNGKNPLVYAVLLVLILLGIGASLLIATGIVKLFG